MDTPIKERYINPFTDFGFKRLFGEEASKPCLIDFLNQLLPPEAKISELTFSHNEHFGKNEMERKAVFDLFCTGKNGEKFIVEIQKAKQKWFKDRSLYYASFPIQEQGRRGEWDFHLQPVYTVGILDFVFDEDKHETDKYLYRIKLSDIETHKIFYEKLTFVYLEAPKFTKRIDQLETRFEKWVYFLKHLSELEEMPVDASSDSVFHRFFEQAELSALSNTERAKYEQSLKIYRDLQNTMDYAKEEGFTEGKIEGKIEGRIEGKIEGKIEGRIEGLAEGAHKKALETALNMLKKNFPVKEIAELTDLSVAQVEELKNGQT